VRSVSSEEERESEDEGKEEGKETKTTEGMATFSLCAKTPRIIQGGDDDQRYFLPHPLPPHPRNLLRRRPPAKNIAHPLRLFPSPIDEEEHDVLNESEEVRGDPVDADGLRREWAERRVSMRRKGERGEEENAQREPSPLEG
jgi:hypothetical protein